MKPMMRRLFLLLGALLLLSGLALAQSEEPQGPIHPRGPVKEGKQSPKQPDATTGDQQQSSDTSGQASSRDNRGDASAPLGDVQEHPDSDSADTGELHLWNPHKADKDVEVGDYHMRRKNYPAAESRYREALEYQNNNAPAMFGLAQALEKEKKHEEAVQYYTLYLKTLPNGPKASDSRAALQRLGRTGA